MLHRHGTHRRIAPALPSDFSALSFRVCGLKCDRRVIAGPGIHRTDDSELVHHRRLQWQMFANLDPRNARGNRTKRATNRGWHVRLHVPHVKLTGTARKPDQNHRASLAARHPFRSLSAGLENRWQRESRCTRQSGLQHPAPPPNTNQRSTGRTKQLINSRGVMERRVWLRVSDKSLSRDSKMSM